MSPVSKKRRLLESGWHISFAIFAVAGAIYHEIASARARRRGER